MQPQKIISHYLSEIHGSFIVLRPSIIALTAELLSSSALPSKYRLQVEISPNLESSFRLETHYSAYYQMVNY